MIRSGDGQMDFKNILKRFEGIKKHDENHYMAKCPVHDDKNPSLSISIDSNKLLIHCYAGCKFEEIIQAVGLTKNDLIMNEKETTRIIYKYFDETGHELYRKVRIDTPNGKKFTFEQPDGTKSVKGIKRVPYNLPDIINATTVFFVEGEKCADILIENGLVATTLDSGSNSKWIASYNQYFKNKEIIIIPDNDSPGNKYAQTIISNLQDSKVMILPNLKDKEDVFDWLKRGNSIDELNNLKQINGKDFLNIFEKGKKADCSRNSSNKPYGITLNILKTFNPEFFHNENNEPFVRVEFSTHEEIKSIKSKEFMYWIKNIYFESQKDTIDRNNCQEVLDYLEAKALFEGEERKLENRVAKKDDVIWYDLTDSRYRAIKITKGNYQIENYPPILFKRFKHQEAQVEPKGCEAKEIYRIFKYINFKKYKTLFLCWLISCFVPGIAHPVFVIYGPQGSAKSTASEIISKIIDPSKLGNLAFPTTPKSLVLNLSDYYFLPFDNLTKISKSTSDYLCRAVTGGGICERKLFTNTETVIYSFKRIISLNGINNVATYPDLLDRSILIELNRIESENRRILSELMKKFNIDLPIILGAVFTVLSKAMVIYPTIELESYPRMADFTKWGFAIGEALGGFGNEFLEEYNDNRKIQNYEAIENDCVAQLIINMMKSQREWTGKVSDLYFELTKLAEETGINTKSRVFPSSPQILSKKMKIVKPNLYSFGIGFEFKRRNYGSIVHIWTEDFFDKSCK